MIRSSKISLQWANDGKRKVLNDFIKAYSGVVQEFVDVLWPLDKFPSRLPKSITDGVGNSSLSARAVQCAAKQAGGIVKGTKAKHKKRLHVLDKLKKEGDTAGVKRLEKTIKRFPLSKPECKNVCPELDDRFCKIELQPSNSFEIWVTLGSLGKEYGKLCLPFQRNTHFNKMLDKGAIKGGVRLSTKDVTFMFELPDPPAREKGKTLGVDIGQNAVLSVSNGFQTAKNKHGHDLVSIAKIISNKKKGSKAFARAVEHRKNYINWSINQMDFTGVCTIVRENLKNMRRGRKSSRMLSHWTYPAIIEKLENRCAELGVLVKTVSPTYTSQRCHRCGFTRKSNRKGLMFKCRACGYTANADLNAALNISLCLPPSGVKRQSKLNRAGFYWLVSGQESIVPAVKQP